MVAFENAVSARRHGLETGGGNFLEHVINMMMEFIKYREEDIRTRIYTIHEDREPPRAYNHPLYTRGRF